MKVKKELKLIEDKGPSVNTSSSYFLWSKKKGGEGVEATENGKLVEKPEENGVGGGVYKHKT